MSTKRQKKINKRNPRAAAHGQNPYSQNRSFNKTMANVVARPGDLCSPAMRGLVKSMTTTSLDGPSKTWCYPITGYYNTTTKVADQLGLINYSNLTRGKPMTSRVNVQMMPNSTGYSWMCINAALIGNNQDAIFTTSNSYTGGASCPILSKDGDTTTFLNRYVAIADDPYFQVPGRTHGFIPTRLVVRLVNQDDSVSARQGYLYAIVSSRNDATERLTDAIMKASSRVVRQDANVLDTDDSPIFTLPILPMVTYHGNLHDYVVGFDPCSVGQSLFIMAENISGNLNFEVTVAGFYVGRDVPPETPIHFSPETYWCAVTCLAELTSNPSDDGTRSEDIKKLNDHAEVQALNRQPGSVTWMQAGMGALKKGAAWAVRALLELYGL